MQGRSRRVQLGRATVLTLALLVASACGGDTTAPLEDPGREQLEVDDAGASLTTQGGQVSLIIPAGALATATVVTVAPVSAVPADPDLVPGTLWDFGPDGLQFDALVTLRLAYDPAGIPEPAGAQDLGIFKRNGSGWLLMSDGTVDAATATVSADIASFSQYGVRVYEPLAITTTSVPAAVQDVDYWEVTYGQGGPVGGVPHLTATGGSGPYAWTVEGGGQGPPGLSLDTEGYIHGTPSVVGSWTVFVEVRSSDGQTARQPFDVRVIPQPVLAPAELCTDYPTYAVPTFAEAALEAAVRDAIADDAMTCGRIGDYGNLEAHLLGITSLVGLQNMTGMQRLDLQGNAIIDLSPLAGLTDLSVLQLQDNSITSLSPLSGLTALYHLNISDNLISDLEPLSGLTAMNSLVASNNSISSIEALRAMTTLDTFVAGNNSIFDIEPLRGLTELIGLELKDNLVVEVAPLRELTLLQTLGLEDNQIGSIAFEQLVNLTQLRLAGNSLGGGTPAFGVFPFRSAIESVATMPALQRLTLDRNPGLGSLEPVENFGPIFSSGIVVGEGSVELAATGVDCKVVVRLLRIPGPWPAVGHDFSPEDECLIEIIGDD